MAKSIELKDITYSTQICDTCARTFNPVSRSIDSEHTCRTHGSERRRHLSPLIKTPSPSLTCNYRSTVVKNLGQRNNGAGRKVRRVQPRKKKKKKGRKVANSWVNFLSLGPVGVARLRERERRERARVRDEEDENSGAFVPLTSVCHDKARNYRRSL